MDSAKCDALGSSIVLFGLFLLATLFYCLWITKKYEKILSWRHAGTISINGSLWFWSIYGLLAELFCSYGIDAHYSGLPFWFLFLVGMTLVDVYFSPEIKYFLAMKSEQDMVDYFDKVKQTSPYLRFHIECSHTIWIEKVHVKGYYRKVVSFTAQSDYPYTTYQDPTDYPDISASFQETPMLAYHMEHIASLGDEFTVLDVACYKEKLMEVCRGRDTNITCEVETNIPGTWTKISSVKTEEKPFWYSLHFYLLSILFSINGIVRIKFQLLSKPRKLVIKKMMFTDPENVVEYNLQGTGTIENTKVGYPNTTMIISHVDPNAIQQQQMGMGTMEQGAEDGGMVYPEQPPPDYWQAVLGEASGV